jgi:hypothetical protein
MRADAKQPTWTCYGTYDAGDMMADESAIEHESRRARFCRSER